MVAMADLPTIGPDESLTEGLERLRESRLDGLPVLDGADLRGVLTRRSIAGRAAGASRRPRPDL